MMTSLARPLSLAVSLAFFAACENAAPSTPASPASASMPAASPSASAASTSPAPSASGSSAAASASPPAPSASAQGSTADPLADAPTLLGPDGKPLGQTEDKPSTGSAAFKRRMELVWKAIVSDDPTVAEPAFFPVEAYEQVKDIKKPAADWKARLLKNFGRDVHEYHKKLGSEPAALRFVGVDVDEPRVKWMDRGKEGNKLGYFRVTRSKLRYADPAGQEKTLELTSLISWRGEWFVVHLHGFK
jgi:hypothetical protein